MENIAETATIKLEFASELLEFFKKTPNSGLICRESNIDACYWKVWALPFDYLMRSLYIQRGLPVPTHILENRWREYGFTTNNLALTKLRVEWLLTLKKSMPDMKKEISTFLEECKIQVSEDELVAGQIKGVVDSQNMQKSLYESENGHATKMRKGIARIRQREAEALELTANNYDFVVPESSWEELGKILKRNSKLTVKGVSHIKVHLPFATSAAAEKYSGGSKGRTIDMVLPFTTDGCFNTDASKAFNRKLFAGVPVGSKFEMSEGKVYLPKHYVVEESYVVGTIVSR